MTRHFTGTHMFGICIAFFGTVIGVNIFMAVEATRTFGGTVVDNSYVASQHFNRWLGEARAAEELGWTAQVERHDNHLFLTLADHEGALDGATILAIAEHPLGQKADVALHFRAIGKGYYRSTEMVPGGRWRLKLDLATKTGRSHLLSEVPA